MSRCERWPTMSFFKKWTESEGQVKSWTPLSEDLKFMRHCATTPKIQDPCAKCNNEFVSPLNLLHSNSSLCSSSFLLNFWNTQGHRLSLFYLKLVCKYCFFIYMDDIFMFGFVFLSSLLKSLIYYCSNNNLAIDIEIIVYPILNWSISRK